METMNPLFSGRRWLLSFINVYPLLFQNKRQRFFYRIVSHLILVFTVYFTNDHRLKETQIDTSSHLVSDGSSYYWHYTTSILLYGYVRLFYSATGSYTFSRVSNIVNCCKFRLLSVEILFNLLETKFVFICD